MNGTQETLSERRESLRQAGKIIIGSAGISLQGWYPTDKDLLDVVERESFVQYWKPNSRDAFMAEHVWEHLTEKEASQANANCYEFLRPGGRLRLAVPDGFHPDRGYIEYVKPGGTGVGSDDHQVLYNYQLLKAQLNEAGFLVCLLEYWDENGEFHFSDWTSTAGHIRRSRRYDPRNQEGSLRYTSLIVDGIKPMNLSGILEKHLPRL
jgi:predicted SAM-dependent methyltransferase